MTLRNEGGGFRTYARQSYKGHMGWIKEAGGFVFKYLAYIIWQLFKKESIMSPNANMDIFISTT